MTFYKTLFCLLLIVTNQLAKAQIVVSLSPHPIVYIGVDNYIDYAVKNIDTGLVELKASIGTLTKNADSQLIWRYCDFATHVVLTAYNKKTGNPIDSIKLGMRYLPDPDISIKELIAHPPHGFLSPTQLYKGYWFHATLTNVDHYIRCGVRKINITLIKKGKQPQMIINEGDRYTVETTKFLEDISEGDTVIFDNAQVKCGCVDRLVTTPLTYIQKNGKAQRLSCQ